MRYVEQKSNGNNRGEHNREESDRQQKFGC